MTRLFAQDDTWSRQWMTLIAEVLVALPIVLAVYSYAAYPAALWLLARRRANALVTGQADYQPSISVVVPAYNEETQIGGAIEALLAQDYPHDKMQILILSDASTDATDRIVSSYADRGVELMRMPKRSGKTAMENAACRLLRGDVVVNSDASIRLHPTTTRKLIEQLSDPSIGVASGCDVSVSVGRPQANATEAGYVNYEMRLRALETQAGGIIGASGCCYAIRADLHRLPIPPDLSRDFSAALTARAHGFRAVSVDDAIAFVPRTQTLRREYTRKVRTIARGMETLLGVAHMLDPMRYGAFSWRLISHKVCRWMVPIVAVPALVALAFLARTHLWAELALALTVTLAGVAAVGAFWPATRPMPRLLSFISFSVAANVAVIHAACRLMYAGDDKIWEPTRREAIIAAP
jgi:cellulose synthase/poly-beta-1,6-N-acetylglucosamine synthase-like glycosyltransferase